MEESCGCHLKAHSRMSQGSPNLFAMAALLTCWHCHRYIRHCSCTRKATDLNLCRALLLRENPVLLIWSPNTFAIYLKPHCSTNMALPRPRFGVQCTKPAPHTGRSRLGNQS